MATPPPTAADWPGLGAFWNSSRVDDVGGVDMLGDTGRVGGGTSRRSRSTIAGNAYVRRSRRVSGAASLLHASRVTVWSRRNEQCVAERANENACPSRLGSRQSASKPPDRASIARR